ncbi:hypothetical protein Zmor_001182 [Zophobas morio]|uniref:von Hippel-Lindau disease tumour suppressor beta domain-containing protein n=1 Tax=Zophobas morio TaxID=2755281 RepID=A0AA38J4Q7_9CUCU|nr:hypothetical protein Zmor_001182 [Zophobas morio]
MAERIEEIRSVRNTDKAYVRFVNCTQRTVELIWANFTGKNIVYQVLEQGQFVDVNTFKKHPWIVLDKVTKDRLHIEGQFVYYPKTAKEYLHERFPTRQFPPDFNVRVQATITLPVYSLKYRCMLAIRNRCKLPKDVERLELPIGIIEDLKRSIAYRNGQMLQPIIRIV